MHNMDLIFIFLNTTQGDGISFYYSRQRGRKKEKKHPLVASYTAPTWDQTRNLGMCPD